MVANLLVHREYLNGRPARFIIYADRVEVDNANHPVGHGPLDPRGFQPFPKNPTLARFFVQLGRVEELGSGVRNVTRYLRAYRPGGQAEFIEEDVFRTVVPVPGNGAAGVGLPDQANIQGRIAGLGLMPKATARLQTIVLLLIAGGPLTTGQVSEQLLAPVRTVRRDFQTLAAAGIIETAPGLGLYRVS